MKILFLCKKQFHDTKMSRSRLQYMAALSKVVEVVNDGPGFPGFSTANASVAAHKPDLVVWYKPLHIPGFDAIPQVPKVMIYNEMYQADVVANEIVKSGTKTLICHHENDIPRFSLPPEYRFIHIPHHIDTSVFYDHGNKDIDVLLAGIIASKIYPLRSRLLKFLHSGVLKGYRLCHYEHPTYRINNPIEQLKTFAATLSRARIVLNCSSSFKYALAKYPEIMGSRSAVAGDIPDERQDWFKDKVIELDEKMSDKEIAGILESYLTNPVKLAEVTENGYQSVSQDYSITKWIGKFMEAVKCST